MRHLRRIGRVAAIVALASVALFNSPQQVAAECTFIPPLPKVSMAIPTARELFVGEVVANGPGGRAVFTVRVDEVLRGPAKVGDLREFRYLEPNWPWANHPGGQPYASCASILASVGEHVILALRARTSGGIVDDGGMRWYQPPTTFNTIGITEGSSREQYGPEGRQLFSLTRLRELAALSPPPTEALDAKTPASASAATPDIRLAVLLLAGLLGGAGGWRRSRRRS